MLYQIEPLSKNCYGCKLNKNNLVKEKYFQVSPSSSFERDHIDFAGPFTVKIFIILVDQKFTF